MSPHLHDEIARLVDEYLKANNEDAGWLAGHTGREWHEAYVRVLSQVCHRMQRSLDWREFNSLRPEIVDAVRRNVRRKNDGPCGPTSNP